MDTTSIKDVSIDHTKLVEARKNKGLSQAEVGRMLNFDRRQVWQFERGIGLTLENFTKLALFYNKPIKYFISE